MEVGFRAYAPSDRAACIEIIRSQVGAYLAEGEDADFEEFLDELETGRSNTYFVIASLDVKPIACGGVTADGVTATLAWGILRSGELAKGYGRALLEHRLGWIRSHHPEVRSVFCQTAPKTEGFFAKHGFEAYHREEKYWGGVLDLVEMELTFDGVHRGSETPPTV